MTSDSVRIVWNEGTMGDWSAVFARIARSTLPQAFGYAQAMGKTHGYVPRLGLIERAGEGLGLVQVLERRHLKLFHERQLHRGPLWFDGVPGEEVLEPVLRLLRKALPSNPLNRASLLPELPAGPAMEGLMARCGFTRMAIGYRTVWLDLTKPVESLRAGFSTTWRQRLKAAEKAGLVIDIDAEAKNLPWLMKQEHDQAAAKGFRAMTGPLAVRLRNALVKADGVMMVAALAGGEPVASALFYGHGRSATYQVGWSNEAGRRSHAMRLVLWRAMQAWKERGAVALDLGGINPDSAPGVTEFKTAMGGEAVETVGLYR
ncbi:GNAT family N-acetyltransferase [Azospirillum sp. RWY-5-1]|uniref:GNAT family N-acetyltransferase n=1 Tax=Azospirillum oleiclasticum TaxID=2735135 RepID=A0ABX2TN28_9PROT|nr:GNAT family N-acetyltransferase [Azospirillum oleiclasticum]NYZ17875.1 GNAT family N-acetyltransferase [Azospirillum oleiclasticum]NYZ25083.1 GNAT family N-acetyltransferase [Azospirillum oleiclasticum]